MAGATSKGRRVSRKTPGLLACVVEPMITLSALHGGSGREADQFQGPSETHVHCREWFVNISLQTAGLGCGGGKHLDWGRRLSLEKIKR